MASLTAATLPLMTLSGQTRAQSEEGQAFITETEARLVFPGSWTRSLRWGTPRKDASPLGREFWWSVEWPARYIVDGRDPEALWLNVGWKSWDLSQKGTLDTLIAKTPLEAMINCLSCDLAVFAMPERDSTKVFASVENGRLVFNVRGREAVKRIFPRIPDRVTFGQMTPTYTEPGYPEHTTSKQTVLVNCRAGRAPASRSCLVVPVVRKLPPNADSAAAENAPRHLFGSVASFSDAIAIPDIDVAIRTTDGKVWKTVSTGKSMFVVLQPPVGHLLLVALCPRRMSPARTPFGTLALEMRARLDTQVTIMTDLRLCSSRSR